MLPTEQPAGSGGVTDQCSHIGRTEEFRINFHPFPIVQSQVRKGKFTELAHGMAFASGDDIVIWLRVLQHSRHGFYILAGMSPITFCLEVSQAEFLAQT